MNATCDKTMATARGSLVFDKIIPALMSILRFFPLASAFASEASGI